MWCGPALRHVVEMEAALPVSQSPCLLPVTKPRQGTDETLCGQGGDGMVFLASLKEQSNKNMGMMSVSEFLPKSLSRHLISKALGSPSLIPHKKTFVSIY